MTASLRLLVTTTITSTPNTITSTTKAITSTSYLSLVTTTVLLNFLSSTAMFLWVSSWIRAPTAAEIFTLNENKSIENKFKKIKNYFKPNTGN